jgi:small-conductance mechanosensitive channel
MEQLHKPITTSQPKHTIFSARIKKIFLYTILIFAIVLLWDTYLLEYVSKITGDKFKWGLGNIRSTFIGAGYLYFLSGISLYVLKNSKLSLKKKIYVRKLLSTFYIFIGLISLSYIWIENQDVFTRYFGFLSIAIAVSFQDFFRNLVGSVVINTTRSVEIGDTIEINEVTGKVIDIGFLYTTLLETAGKNGNDINQVSTKEIKLPNQLFNNNVARSFDMRDDFLWDEIVFTLPEVLPRNLNLSELEKEMYHIIKTEMQEFEQPSKAFLKRLNNEILGVDKKSWTIELYFDLIDVSTSMTVRYLVRREDQREVRSRIVKHIHREFLNRPSLNNIQKINLS